MLVSRQTPRAPPTNTRDRKTGKIVSNVKEQKSFAFELLLREGREQERKKECEKERRVRNYVFSLIVRRSVNGNSSFCLFVC